MPILALRGLTVFPDQTVHFDVGRKKSVLALEAAMKKDQRILLIPQKDILVEPKNALSKQYQSLLAMDGVALEITDEALGMIAQKAIDRQIGARGLRAIMEKIMTKIMFLIPSDLSIKKVIITPETIDGADPTILRDPAHPREKLTGRRR